MKVDQARADHDSVFISLIFLIMLGSLSLSHSAKRIRSCIFSRVSFSILANSADISSILFLSSNISFSLFFSFSSCYFLVRAIVSLFFSNCNIWYWVLLLFLEGFCWVARAHHYILSAFACTDGSWLICITSCLHYREHFLFLGFQVALEIHHSLFYFILARTTLVSSFLLDDSVKKFVPSCFCRVCTLLLRICTLSASSSGPYP